VKTRRVVVINYDEEIAAGCDPIYVVAISTQVDSLLASEHAPYCVLMPFSNRGDARTGLTKKGMAVCSWVEPVPRRDVLNAKHMGTVPGKTMIEIAKALKAHQDAID